MTNEITRKDLYREIWSRPAVQVAAQYGVSNVALKKICRKHRIPVPGRGYWQRKTAGKKTEPMPPLGAAEVSGPIAIRGSRLPDLPEGAKEALRRARERERRPENLVDVAAAPAGLHPAVAATWDALDTAEASETGMVIVSGPKFFHVDVAQERVPRAMIFLHALVTAAESRGYRLEEMDEALAFAVGGQAVDFKLLELVDRTPHEPTEEEKLAVRKWESLHRMFPEAKNLDTVMPQPRIPDLDFAPSGRLQVVLAEGQPGGSGLRRVFGDGDRQQIEKLINPILVAMATWAAVIGLQQGT